MGSHWISWDLVLPRSTTGGRKKYRNSLWRFFAAMQEKAAATKNAVAAQKCRKSETWLLTTSWLNVQQLLVSRLCHVTHQTLFSYIAAR